MGDNKRALRGWVIPPFIAAIVVALDQWTKGLVEANVPLGGFFTPFPALEPYLNIVHTTNTGAAFGLLQGQSGLLIVVALVVIALVVYFAREFPTGHRALRMCLGVQLGGALGNLVDRLQHGGAVTDFLLLSLPVGGRVYQWPAFNVADSCIVVGTILLGILLLRDERLR